MRKRWVWIFLAVVVLLIAQVIWWTTVFMKDVDVIAALKSQQVFQSVVSIQSEVFHRRVMFLSESISFVCLACFGLYLLYSALKVEERARETERNFIEVISHESKTPLTVLTLQLDSLIGRVGDSTVKEDLQSAREEVRRLTSLFEKAMNLNRFERATFQKERILFSDLIHEAVHSLRSLFRNRRVELDLELASDVSIDGDPDALRNSIQCLLENAALYNQAEPKRIRVTLSSDEGKACLRIYDNGTAIAPKDRKRIFERFYRGDRNPTAPGTGLGLYLTKTIVEAHRGMVRLACEEEGGNSFSIELPLSSGSVVA